MRDYDCAHNVPPGTPCWHCDEPGASPPASGCPLEAPSVLEALERIQDEAQREYDRLKATKFCILTAYHMGVVDGLVKLRKTVCGEAGNK